MIFLYRLCLVIRVHYKTLNFDIILRKTGLAKTSGKIHVWPVFVNKNIFQILYHS